MSHATAEVEVMDQAGPVGGAAVVPTAESAVRNRNFWFAVIFLIFAVDHADRFLVSAVVPSVKEEFGLSDAGVGLMSGMLHIGLGLLALPAGMLVDRFSRKYMIVIMTTIWTPRLGPRACPRATPGCSSRGLPWERGRRVTTRPAMP